MFINVAPLASHSLTHRSNWKVKRQEVRWTQGSIYNDVSFMLLHYIQSERAKNTCYSQQCCFDECFLLFSRLHSYHFHLCYAQCRFSSTNASAILESAQQSHITWVDWKQNNGNRSQHTSSSFSFSSSFSSFGESPLTQWFQYNIYI